MKNTEEAITRATTKSVLFAVSKDELMPKGTFQAEATLNSEKTMHTGS